MLSKTGKLPANATEPADTVLLRVKVGNLAVASVPDAILDAFKAVNVEPYPLN